MHLILQCYIEIEKEGDHLESNFCLESQEDDAIFIESIIREEQITTYYQPIVNLRSGEVLGYEALSRGPEKTPYYSPLVLIERAKVHQKTWELEMLFRKKALERLNEIKQDKLLFINVDPDIIKTNEFKSGLTKEYLNSIGGEEKSIVFEITERTAINDYEAFYKILENYRSQGYQIAIDDVGAGYSGMKTINEIRPNYIKIDMDLIRNIDKDAFKQALIKAFVDTSMITNIKIIAEGIETKEELKTLIILGVHAGQGYYLKKPSDQFGEIESEVLVRIRDYNKISNNLNEYSKEYHFISNLITSHENLVYESMTPCITVKHYLDKSNLKSVCICENNRPVGIVMKHNMDATMSGQYGYSLYSNKQVSKVMNSKPLVVDLYTPIHVVAKSAMERSDETIFDDIVITKSSRYYGMVSMKRIFEYTLMYEKNNAKESNPLTGLPGNPIIARVLKDLVSYETNSCILYVDINEFKVYNDVYGFERGDDMIQYVSRIIQEVVKTRFPYSSFIGHIGGDDFLVVVNGEHADYLQIAQQMMHRFEEDKKTFFSKSHFDSGAIEAEDRFGIKRHLALTSISISGIFGDLSSYETPEILSEALANIKKIVKKSGKSDYALMPVCLPETEFESA